MSKIVTAINAMISNSGSITNVVQGDMDSECFFVYDNKHTWSIIENKEGKYFLHYYPGNPSANELAGIPSEHWHEADIRSVVYTSEVLGTKEALDSLKELNSIVREKLYGMDSVLEEIIGTGKF
ncbi:MULTISPECIES: hypothetical protein [unclassified Vibrio]|uniref:hypothetical protein n=1 Tax=unclassified Vibrio TaxID=2614977 RepID=UPI0002DDEF7F|nr:MULTISPECIES: hypothetical protein [unclassified Vibrio]ELB2110542.1 hypothetical protein [Vibrio parahaemolyticus]CAK4070805.1 hypothetical protein VDT1_2672 [Vibrio sp. 16]